MQKCLIKMNKKGSILDMIVFVISAIIIILVLAMWFYGWQQIDHAFQSISGNAVIENAVDTTFGQVTPAFNNLKWWSYMIIFALVISMFITNYLRRISPFFIIGYIFMNIIALILAVNVSNSYESLLNDPITGTTLQSFQGSTFIILYLPIWVIVIGFIGLIFLFAGIIRDSINPGLSGGSVL